MTEVDEINTEARTRFLSRIPVQVSVRALQVVEDDGDDEAFVVVARNMSDRNKLIENMQTQEAHMKNVLSYAEFDAQFTKNAEFRSSMSLVT